MELTTAELNIGINQLSECPALDCQNLERFPGEKEKRSSSKRLPRKKNRKNVRMSSRRLGRREMRGRRRLIGRGPGRLEICRGRVAGLRAVRRGLEAVRRSYLAEIQSQNRRIQSLKREVAFLQLILNNRQPIETFFKNLCSEALVTDGQQELATNEDLPEQIRALEEPSDSSLTEGQPPPSVLSAAEKSSGNSLESVYTEDENNPVS